MISCGLSSFLSYFTHQCLDCLHLQSSQLWPVDVCAMPSRWCLLLEQMSLIAMSMLSLQGFPTHILSMLPRLRNIKCRDTRSESLLLCLLMNQVIAASLLEHYFLYTCDCQVHQVYKWFIVGGICRLFH